MPKIARLFSSSIEVGVGKGSGLSARHMSSTSSQTASETEQFNQMWLGERATPR